ncbi:hypothetical protein K439DRAFT_1627114 [Ramaria rubella]|nr:hypothetical protein K439DRAFT_1627114 [Ramaria rubella]
MHTHDARDAKGLGSTLSTSTQAQRVQYARASHTVQYAHAHPRTWPHTHTRNPHHDPGPRRMYVIEA